jgi:RimJ/RimL family protein N-acetyltransferase
MLHEESQLTIRFEKATLAHQATVFAWLDTTHMQEFWDNSPEHRADILIFMDGRPVPSTYFAGIFSYWVGVIDDTPYCLIMTSEACAATNPPDYCAPYLSTTGKTFGLDFGIGNPHYLGQGLAAPTLEAFMLYFAGEIEPTADTFLIDPMLDNRRAIHVYQKAGFTPVREFISGDGTFADQKGLLMVRKL